jgi:imidazoleglycerol-phosphate dehydratase
MVAIERADKAGRARVRVAFPGSGSASVTTGVSVLDHLLGLLAWHAGVDLSLEIAPDAALEEAAFGGRMLGEALGEALTAEGARGHGSGHVPADEALAHVALEASGRPLVVSNVDLSAARVAGLGADVVARFLDELAAGAGLTLHVRLVEGEETEHVLEAIFKALGAALGQAMSQRI